MVTAGALGATALVAGAAVGWPLVPDRVKQDLGLQPAPDPFIPDAPEGQVTLETVPSSARGRDVSLFTAVPAGYGDGEGLPVVIVLHGATGRPTDYQAFGLGRFLTAAVEQGSRPFVLAGADGGTLRWSPQPDGDDPRAMVVEEMPQWLADRGFDADRRALWGWSMGGYGALRLIEVSPGYARATAAFSPAVGEGDEVFTGVDQLAPERLGIWCGTDDPLYPAVTSLVGAIAPPPAIASFSPGGHTRVFWNNQTLEAFAFLSDWLWRRAAAVR